MSTTAPGRGFSLVELLVVISIIAIIATIALPFLLSSKISANEKAAVATLRLIGQAQVQFASSDAADEDANGSGEYGTLGELSGTIAVRAANGGTKFFKPQVLSPAFGIISPLGEFVRHGYYFRLYLPDGAGDGMRELPGGGADAGIDAAASESIWSVYAWPARQGHTGRRTFFTNQTGEFYFTDSPVYSGAGAPIMPGSALEAGGAAASMKGQPANGTLGRDGNTWRTLGD